MHLTVTHFGYSPLKGARHQARTIAEITASGPTFNRRWALVSPADRTVLRTVANPSLMGITTDLINDGDRTELTLHIPGAGSYTVPALTNAATSTFTSWGAEKQLAVYNHRVNDALSTYLCKPVALAFAPRQNLVYAGALSLVGSATLDDIAARLNPENPPTADELAARLRCNLVVETSTPYIEDRWQGTTLTLQSGRGLPTELHGLQLVAGEGIGRCAVIDYRPDTGQRTAKFLKLLASYRPRNQRGEPTAGVYASLISA
ncbi:MAG: MOSC domain-containing protein [Rothia sp. (in: high G+C Gram-positive bacteria)]|uniref:MOSC N-terminal beta barrel domain-containing protein n=1 Tax=Rothia sp. (in: high G+C Gram-positive bacteria) TaxID=1885016 RepID=UPI0026FA4410|nr:MOSC domain-containing protein [Rothia sp. (in: high G+C Gram-positive bacteria)]